MVRGAHEKMASMLSSARSYLVPRGLASAEIVEKKSRFLCLIERVSDEAEAREFIAMVRAEHRLARHHCSAFVIGADRQLRRSNDDGEPSGTAGAPMLDALIGARPHGDVPCSDLVAVVVRWFGGVLLGAGGLVRAYGDATSAALEQVQWLQREERTLWELDAPHAEAGRWEHELRARGLDLLPPSYGASAATLTLTLDGTLDEQARAEAIVAELGRGRTLRPAGREWIERAVS